MATTVYIANIDWKPDETVVNSAQGIQYVAWRIGEDKKLGQATWLIAQVRFPDPGPVPPPGGGESLAPIIGDGGDSPIPPEDDSTIIILQDDVPTLGQVRTVQNKTSIADVQSDFEAEVARVLAAIDAGTR
jgi:hypothetical protein